MCTVFQMNIILYLMKIALIIPHCLRRILQFNFNCLCSLFSLNALSIFFLYFLIGQWILHSLLLLDLFLFFSSFYSIWLLLFLNHQAMPVQYNQSLRALYLYHKIEVMNIQCGLDFRFLEFECNVLISIKATKQKIQKIQ